MCVACFGGARMGCKSELSDAVGDCSMRYFASEVFVTRAPSLSGSCEEDVMFLC